MIAHPKMSTRSLLIATACAVVGHLHQMTTIASLSLCSAWTLNLGIHNHRGFHPNKHRTPKRRRQQSSLFSTQTTAPNNNISAEPTSYRDLFPASDRITNGTLQVDSIHTLYYEIHGTGPLHALFLHGGPGAGCFPNHARFFDPQKYTVVLLDQRGAGKSQPRGCVQENTLDHLVEDCERIRKHLLPLSGNSQTWDVVLGGSWGATLGLAYAQKYPSSLKSLLLRGICTLRPSEIDWLFGANGGSAQSMPEAWQNFSSAMGTLEDRGRETLHAYYDCFFNREANSTADNAIRLAAARSWMMWEMGVTATSSRNESNPSENTVLVYNNGMWGFENHLRQPVYDHDRSAEIVAQELRKGIDANHQNKEKVVNSPRPVRPLEESLPLFESMRKAANSNGNSNRTGGWQLPADYVPAQAMLTCFYSVNDLYVMGNKNLLLAPSAIGQPPVKIIGIQGGNDPICPPDTALDLLQSSNMELRIPLQSGHSMYDPAIKHELVQATDRLADEFLE